MNLFSAIKGAVAAARESGYIFYVYVGQSGYVVASEYSKGWLFQAYPGGRRVLSFTGAALVEEAKRRSGSALDGIIGEGG